MSIKTSKKIDQKGLKLKIVRTLIISQVQNTEGVSCYGNKCYVSCCSLLLNSEELHLLIDNTAEVFNIRSLNITLYLKNKTVYRKLRWNGNRDLFPQNSCFTRLFLRSILGVKELFPLLRFVGKKQLTPMQIYSWVQQGPWDLWAHN